MFLEVLLLLRNVLIDLKKEMNGKDKMMKKGLLVATLALVLVGCGKAGDTTTPVDNVSVETSEATVTQKEEAVVVDSSENEKEVNEEAVNADDVKSAKDSDDAKNAKDSDDAEEEHTVLPVAEEDGSASENAVESLKTYLKEMKLNHNSEPVDLTVRIGEFGYWSDDDMDLIDDPDGEIYGFWQDITPGCSVWCAVMDNSVSVETSSTLAPQGKYNYEADNLIDGNRNDAWVEGVDGTGIGETISITKSYDTSAGEMVPDEESVFFYEMCIVNGLARNEKVWKENGRVKLLKFYFNGEYQGTIELEDTMKPQFVSLSGLNLAAKNCENSTFSFEIEDVYPGEKYEDTALTGIEIAFDSPNH